MLLVVYANKIMLRLEDGTAIRSGADIYFCVIGVSD